MGGTTWEGPHGRYQLGAGKKPWEFHPRNTTLSKSTMGSAVQGQILVPAVMLGCTLFQQSFLWNLTLFSIFCDRGPWSAGHSSHGEQRELWLLSFWHAQGMWKLNRSLAGFAVAVWLALKSCSVELQKVNFTSLSCHWINEFINSLLDSQREKPSTAFCQNKVL